MYRLHLLEFFITGVTDPSLQKLLQAIAVVFGYPLELHCLTLLLKITHVWVTDRREIRFIPIG